MNAIVVNNINKQYNTGIKALDDVSLTIKQGEVFTLLGKNGAGKSTLISILTTAKKASSGTIKVLSHQISNKTVYEIRKDIACVAQKISIDEHLTLLENMMFQSRIYKIDSTEAKERIDTLIRTFDLESYLHYPVANYSGGVKRRLDIAINMVTNPKILFLDEPTVGMDVFSRNAMWECVSKIKETFGTTIFLTTHYLEEAEFLSDTICILDKGKIVTQGSKEQLSSVIKKKYLSLTINDVLHLSKAEEVIKKNFPTHSVIRNETNILIEDKDLILLDIMQLLDDSHISYSGIQKVVPSLEDIFVEILKETAVNIA